MKLQRKEQSCLDHQLITRTLTVLQVSLSQSVDLSSLQELHRSVWFVDVHSFLSRRPPLSHSSACQELRLQGLFSSRCRRQCLLSVSLAPFGSSVLSQACRRVMVPLWRCSVLRHHQRVPFPAQLCMLPCVVPGPCSLCNREMLHIVPRFCLSSTCV